MQKKIKGKKLDSEITAMFNKHGHRRQYNIMDLGKISAAGRSAYDAAATHEDGLMAADAAVAVACDRYEVRPEAPASTRKIDPNCAYSDAEVSSCLAASLKEAAEDAPSAEGDLDFRIPGL